MSRDYTVENDPVLDQAYSMRRIDENLAELLEVMKRIAETLEKLVPR